MVMNQVTVTLDRCCAGRVLAVSVLDQRGGVVLAAGTTLSIQQVEGLMSQGVRSLVLCASATETEAQHSQTDAEGTPVPPAPTSEQMWSRLQHLFRHSLRAGEINPLLHLIKRYRERSSP